MCQRQAAGCVVFSKLSLSMLGQANIPQHLVPKPGKLFIQVREREILKIWRPRKLGFEGQGEVNRNPDLEMNTPCLDIWKRLNLLFMRRGSLAGFWRVQDISSSERVLF